MVAVSIVAIISTVGLISYSQTQLLGRDAKRKEDLRSIAIALEIYKQKNGRYPCHTEFADSTNTLNFWISDSSTVCTGGPAIPLNTDYINYMPIDPKDNNNLGNGGNPGIYGYSYWTPPQPFCVAPYPTTPGQFYILRTRLENAKDPDACKNKNYKNCDNQNICPGGENQPKNDLFVITSQ